MTANPETREIRDGIEWYGDDNQCARCGSSADFRNCFNCGGEGFTEEDYGDAGMEEMRDVRCEYCNGVGGKWHCLSSPAHCESHPMAGREQITSTALNSEAWNDH